MCHGPVTKRFIHLTTLPLSAGTTTLDPTPQNPLRPYTSKPSPTLHLKTLSDPTPQNPLRPYTSKPSLTLHLKTLSKNKWKQQHPNYNQSDSLHKLNRPEQVILFRFRTGHNRLNAYNQSDSLYKLYRPEQVILFRFRTRHNRLNAYNQTASTN